MIAAMANGRVIGADNQMPWHLPADLAHFKRITMGKPIVMGRKTYESIGRALPGRLNIVISRDETYQLADATVVHSCEHAVAVAGDPEELMVIGGGTIYGHFLPLCQRLYLTLIDLDVEGDIVFPDYLSAADWNTTEQEFHSPDDKNPYSYQFVTLEKTSL